MPAPEQKPEEMMVNLHRVGFVDRAKRSKICVNMSLRLIKQSRMRNELVSGHKWRDLPKGLGG